MRWMRYGRTATYEQITEFRAPHCLGCTVVGGLLVRDYSACVTLTPVGDGTRVEGQETRRPTLLGRVVQRRLRMLYPQIVQSLIDAAEHSVGDQPESFTGQ